MSNVASNGDEGGCNTWTAFFENKNERRRNLALALRYLGDPYEAEDVLQDASIRPRPSIRVHARPVLPGKSARSSTLVHAGPALSGRIVVATTRDRLAVAADRALARHRARRALWIEAGHDIRRWRELAKERAR